MQVAQKAGFTDRMNGIVVENAVVPLVARAEDFFRLASHSAHLFALVHAVAHELFCKHVLAGTHGLD